jgi:hypothetical protein
MKDIAFNFTRGGAHFLAAHQTLQRTDERQKRKEGKKDQRGENSDNDQK